MYLTCWYIFIFLNPFSHLFLPLFLSPSFLFFLFCASRPGGWGPQSPLPPDMPLASKWTPKFWLCIHGSVCNFVDWGKQKIGKLMIFKLPSFHHFVSCLIHENDHRFKGALDNFSLIPIFFSKSCYIIRSLYRMLLLHAKSYLQLQLSYKYMHFSFSSHF